MGGPGPAAAQPCYWGVYIQGTQFVLNQVFCLHGDPQFAFHSLLIQGQRVAQGTGTELGGRGRGWGGWAVPRLPLEGATLLAQHWLGNAPCAQRGFGEQSDGGDGALAPSIPRLLPSAPAGSSSEPAPAPGPSHQPQLWPLLHFPALPRFEHPFPAPGRPSLVPCV